MDEVFENSHGFNSKDLEDFFRLKLEMETREGKYNEKKKENEKDVKKRYKMKIRLCNILVWLKND